MTRDDLDELMLIYAAGVADVGERVEAEGYLAAGDLIAQSSYAEAVAVLAAMPLSLERTEVPRNVRDRLLLRVTMGIPSPASMAIPVPGVRTADRRPTWRRPAWPTYAAIGVAAALAIALTLTIVRQNEIARGWAQSVQDVRMTREVMGSPYVTLAKMTAEGSRQNSYGRVLYCPQSHQYQVAVYHLNPPQEGRVFELWLVTPDQKKIPAGTFEVDESGFGMIAAAAPRGIQVVTAVITDEPTGGSEQPTGSTHLVASLENR